MKITDIKAQVKREGRYSIYVDDKYSFSLSEGELLKLGIKIGQEFTVAELDELKDKAEEDKALMRAYDLLARRPRSTWEMEQYLKRKDYSPELIKNILNTLSDRQLLDDESFARAWVENRRLLKPTSKRSLLQELQQKRISNEIATLVLAEDEIDEQALLREVIEKKRSIPRYHDEQKLIAYLLRQGYNYGDIKQALEEV